MDPFTVRVVLLSFALSDVVNEKVEEAIDTNHVSDVEITEKRYSKEKGVELKFSMLDQRFDSKRDEREPHQGIDPHRVVLLYHRVAGQCVKGGENENGEGLLHLCGLFDIKAKGKAANSNLYKKERKQRLQHTALRE